MFLSRHVLERVSEMPVRRDETGRWRYRIVVDLPSGRRQRISGSAPRHINTKVACLAEERRAVEEAFNQKNVDEKKEVPLVREFYLEFMSTYVKANNKPSEQISKECIFRTRLLPEFGEKHLDDIGVRDVERFKAKLLDVSEYGRPKSPKTINNTLSSLGKMLRYAEELGVIDDVPRVRFIKVTTEKFDFLEFEEMEQLLEGARLESEVLAAVLLGSEAGLRIGEIRSIKFGDIDFHRGLLTVQRTNYRGHITSPKSGRIRTIPMTKRLLAALKAIRHLKEWVFCNDENEPWSRGEGDARLWRACRRAGLRRIKWHALRHTFCSHLAMRGASPRAIQELAGHAQLSCRSFDSI